MFFHDLSWLDLWQIAPMQPRYKTLLIQVTLFVCTLITTTLAGTEWTYGRLIIDYSSGWLTWDKIWHGLYFSLPFLGILTIHEFGHYFTAKKNKVDVTLPYYIPFWFGLGLTLGTFGAFIRLKSKALTNKQYFDIGIAGPLAGFAAALVLLSYGFTHLPPKDYIFAIFPEFKPLGLDYIHHLPEGFDSLYLGDNLLFTFFETYIADPSLVPPKYELMHHPFLLAGFLSLFFTSMNLLPIGQLDGGHVLYGLIGHRWHTFVSKVLFIAFISYAGIGILDATLQPEELLLRLGLYILFLYNTLRTAITDVKNRWMIAVMIASGQFFLVYLFPSVSGYPFWLVFAFILGRFLGVEHPKAEELPIDTGRKLLGWLSLVIFILCFSPQPFK